MQYRIYKIKNYKLKVCNIFMKIDVYEKLNLLTFAVKYISFVVLFSWL